MLASVARRTRGLVDPTLLDEVEGAGYRTDRGEPLPLAVSLHRAPPRRPAAPDPRARWAQVAVDPATRTVTRPPGIHLDSGGVAKGLFADLAGQSLARCDS